MNKKKIGERKIIRGSKSIAMAHVSSYNKYIIFFCSFLFLCVDSKNNFQMTAANFNFDTYVTYPTIMIATMNCV